jgi:hypothetical protein
MSAEVLQELRVAVLAHQTAHPVAALGEKLCDVPADKSRRTGQTDPPR